MKIEERLLEYEQLKKQVGDLQNQIHDIQETVSAIEKNCIDYSIFMFDELMSIIAKFISKDYGEPLYYDDTNCFGLNAMVFKDRYGHYVSEDKFEGMFRSISVSDSDEVRYFTRLISCYSMLKSDLTADYNIYTDNKKIYLDGMFYDFDKEHVVILYECPIEFEKFPQIKEFIIYLINYRCENYLEEITYEEMETALDCYMKKINGKQKVLEPNKEK